MYEVDTRELRVVMAEQGFVTGQSLAEASGVSRNTVQGILNGKVYPSSKVMNALCAALSLEGERAGRIFFAPKLT